MYRLAVVAVLLAAGCASTDKGPLPVQPPSGPRRGVFISPMGEPFRASTGGGDLIGRWFAGADADHDGALTRAEMEADAVRFFRTLDSDGNGELGPPEIAHYETEVAPEISLGSQMGRFGGPRQGRMGRGGGRRGGGGPGGGGPGGGMPRGEESGDGGQVSGKRATSRLPEGASRYALLDLPEPVIAADADFDRAVSAAEFRAAAAERFAALDRDRDGRIMRSELEPLPPPAPATKRR